MNKIPVAVFASGRGSNFDAIVNAIRHELLDAQIVALVCDCPDAPVMEKAKGLKIPVLLEQVPEISDRQVRRREHEKKIVQALGKYSPRFLVLAGYRRLFSPEFISEYDSGKGYSRIVNIHPSLLPAFPGLNSYRKAFEYGCKVAGATVHLVTPELDAGPICAQESFTIEDCRSAEEVEQRGLTIEHALYPLALQWVIREEFTLEKTAGRSRVRPS